MWDHTKNDKRPDEISVGSGRKIWLVCSKGHSYKSTPYKVNSGRGCGVCDGKVVLAGVNDLQSRYPKVAEMMDDPTLSPTEVTPQSSKKVRWYCFSGGHHYNSIVSDRVKGHGCPYCTNRKLLVGFNDLQTKYPYLSGQLKYIDPKTIKYSSRETYTWECSRKHLWKSTVKNRVSGKGCPYCAGTKVLKGFNDLQTVKPELAKEWGNNPKGPHEYTYSSGKKVNWICVKGHSWNACINNRYRGSSCPECIEYATSNVEKSLRDLVSKHPKFADTIGKANHKIITTDGVSRLVDIFTSIDGKPTVIEYDGSYYHKDSHDRDKLKTMSLLESGYSVIRIREHPLEFLTLSDDNLTQIGYKYTRDHNGLLDIVNAI